MSDHTPLNNEIPYGFCHCGCGQETNTRNGKRNKFLHNHHNYVRRTRADMSIEEVAPHFWKKVSIDRRRRSSCWEWEAGYFPNGYGCFWDGTKPVGAHRFAYIIEHGSIPDGVLICHTCDNKKCVNPSHLFAGEPIDNIHDMLEKGRENKASGGKHWKARFTNQEVRQFRNQFANMRISMQGFARLHDVPDETMRKILKRISYQDA